MTVGEAPTGPSILATEWAGCKDEMVVEWVLPVGIKRFGVPDVVASQSAM